MPIDFARIRNCLQDFDFRRLFIEELGWSQPTARSAASFEAAGATFTRRHIAQLAGVVVFEITAPDGRIPDAKARLAVHREIARLHHEHLLIFVDRPRTQSLWYWVKREDGKLRPRDHYFFKGQPGDLFIAKLAAMVFDLGDFDAAGHVPVVEVANRLKTALDVERVTKQFFRDYQEQHLAFLELIRGVPDEHDRRWYASVLLNRLMFIYFLQRKGFLDYKNPAARDGNQAYLQDKLAESRARGPDRFFRDFLKTLFFEGFAKPQEQRSPEARRLLGKIRYLNGGLFLPHKVERDCPDLDVPDKAFENLFSLFQRYSWNLNDTPGERDDEIRPDVLGYIFEKYINQKAFGAYYTRTEITEYLCEQTIHRLILDAVNTPGLPGLAPARRFETVADLLMNLDATLCRRLLLDVLPNLSLLDPACGSGAFLVAALRTLINIYSAVIGKIKFVKDTTLSGWLADREREHRSLAYFIKKTIITENLYGVDIMEEATEIARLRLFLALVASVESVDQLEPLPNIDFNILAGNSLIGLMRVDDKEFEKRLAGQLFRQRSYRQIVEEKNRLIENFRHTAQYADDLTALRDRIEQQKRDARDVLDDLLLAEFEHLGIKYEQATWDDRKNDEGKPVKRALTLDDIRALKPFHWGYEFDEILNQRGGFDAIITNPPWEVFERSEQEFLKEHLPEAAALDLSRDQWCDRFRQALRDSPALQAEWCKYSSRFPHAAAFLKESAFYAAQRVVDDQGNRLPTKLNLYRLFLERILHLLRSYGQAGLVIPTTIWTGRGAQALRRLLFESTVITGAFGFRNTRGVFENVGPQEEFLVLTLYKDMTGTHRFPVAFMREDTAELGRFPGQGAFWIDLETIRGLYPRSMRVPELGSSMDVRLCQKLARQPGLDDASERSWGISLRQEFNMTAARGLFCPEPRRGRLPLVQGASFGQFCLRQQDVRIWIDEDAGRRRLLGRASDTGAILPYQTARLVHQRIARKNQSRTLVATVIPPYHFCADTAHTPGDVLPSTTTLYLTAVMNSFVCDFQVRLIITSHLDKHIMDEVRIPRLTAADAAFGPIVERAARLICTTPEFDALAREVGLRSHKQGATDPAERARLRAELDGLIAHLYGLTEDEFAYILTTFPLVAEDVKQAAREAYGAVERGLIK